MKRVAIILGVVALLVGSCSGDEAETTTTTTTFAPVTTAPGASSTTTTPGGTGTTTTTEGSAAVFPAYEIVSRVPGEAGDVVVVVLDPTSYETLTDIDLQNVVADLVERFPPVAEAHVVDDPMAVPLVLATDLDDEQRQVLAEHYLVRLEDGFRIIFTGPFESAGVGILGS